MKKWIVTGCVCTVMVLAACKGSIHNAAATDTSGKLIHNPNDSTGGGNIINKDSTSTDPGDGTPANDADGARTGRKGSPSVK